MTNEELDEILSRIDLYSNCEIPGLLFDIWFNMNNYYIYYKLCTNKKLTKKESICLSI